MRFGVIGSGSWGTALVKILTDNHQALNWWIRNPAALEHISKKSHNPQYLSSVYFDKNLIRLTGDLEKTGKRETGNSKTSAMDCLAT